MFQRNPDRDIRDLDRLAATGDIGAKAQLEHELFRRNQSLKNIDNEILLARLEQWFGILLDIERFLVNWHAWEAFTYQIPSRREVDRWKESITSALNQEPVDVISLGPVVHRITRYTEDLSEYFADDLDHVYINDESLSDVWEGRGDQVVVHLRDLIRAYSPIDTLSWWEVARDDYSEQDNLADIANELAREGRRDHSTDPVTIGRDEPRGRVPVRGPIFMPILTPLTKTEVRLPFTGITYWAGNTQSNYTGEYLGHRLSVRELTPNQWHAEIDGEDLVEHGELGERWQEAAELVGKWLDENAIPWMYCHDGCKQHVVHPEPCIICSKASDLWVELGGNFDEEDIIYPKHVCYRCTDQRGAFRLEDIKYVCHRCATVCGRCQGTVCNDICAGICKECGMDLCGSFDCGPRCLDCDADLCWECKSDTEQGSSCKECLENA